MNLPIRDHPAVEAHIAPGDSLPHLARLERGQRNYSQVLINALSETGPPPFKLIIELHSWLHG
jgi:hypothetical protein